MDRKNELKEIETIIENTKEVKKIEEKEFKRENLREIVRFYNTQCGK